MQTVTELSERIDQLEAIVAENRRVIESQQQAIGRQQQMLRELNDVYCLLETAMIEVAYQDSPSPDSSRPDLRLLR